MSENPAVEEERLDYSIGIIFVFFYSATQAFKQLSKEKDLKFRAKKLTMTNKL
jgi:hypothetical protein